MTLQLVLSLSGEISDHRVALNESLPMQNLRIAVIALALTAGVSSGVADETSVRVLNPSDLAPVDRIVHSGMSRGEMPGAVVLVSHHGQVVFRRAWGQRQVEPEPEEMTPDTVFDMASITKPVATASSVMKLLDEGKIELMRPVATWLPEFGTKGKEQITVYHLLTHQGGLIPDNSIRDYEGSPEESWQKICDLDLNYEIGTRFRYTDVGFIVLGELVKRVSGQPVNEFAAQHLFRPLGMADTGYLPPDTLRSRISPTEKRGAAGGGTDEAASQWIRGVVHDPRALRLGGVAGHAGLFSTADDLAKYGQMMLGEGKRDSVQVLSPETVALMTDAYPVPGGGFRGLGWDKQSGYSSNRGDLFSERAFGHGGFTGTVLWIDPELDIVFVFLSSRLHPDGKGTINALAGRIATVVAAAARRANAAADSSDVSQAGTADNAGGRVLTGIDVLQRDGFATLDGRKVGLITNHTGLTRDGSSIVTAMKAAGNFELAALFSPEHGFEGLLDQSRIGDAVDPLTGLKIHSLYGATRSPTPEMLEGLDTLVFDIQDIGTRFYTYISTMGNAMRAAEQHGLRFVVLDRPNPINGVDVQGPVLDDGTQSFVGFHTIPVRHGMTVGEIATLIRHDLTPGLDLQVVRTEGWNREDLYDATGLIWTNPSPNMRSLNQAILYPGIGLLETTNLSVGRGTDTPFEVLGAPWINGQELAAEIQKDHQPGMAFLPIRFTPTSSKYKDELCGGVMMQITDRDRVRPLALGLSMARALRSLYPDDWETRSLNRLLSDEVVLEDILAGRPVKETVLKWQPELRKFRIRRKACLLYP